MGHSVAVMNTKGGVGKSTIVMALAETLSVHHGKNVLVVDSDSQTSMSTMLMHVTRWEEIEGRQRTLVDFLSNKVLGAGDAKWRDYVAVNVSDVDDANSIYLFPSHMELSLFEREISAQKKEVELRTVIREFLADAGQLFDVVLIDCPPGLSILTECWLRECNYFMPPTKPDYLAVRGLSILKRFRKQHSEQGFAKLLGVLVNLKDGRIGSEDEWHKKLLADPENDCFEAAIPRRSYIQRAADYDPNKRTFIAKYPGDAGQAVKALAEEFLARLSGVATRSKAKVDAVAKPQVAARPSMPQPIAAKPAAGKVELPRPAAKPESVSLSADEPRIEPKVEASGAADVAAAVAESRSKPAVVAPNRLPRPVAAEPPPTGSSAAPKMGFTLPKPVKSQPVPTMAFRSAATPGSPGAVDDGVTVDLAQAVPAKPILPRPVPPVSQKS